MSADQLPTERRRLADFTTDLRVIPLSLICIVIGVIGAYLALILLKLIYLFTNLFFFHHWSFDYKSPALTTGILVNPLLAIRCTTSVKRSEPRKVIGVVSLTDLMKARIAAQDTEQRRERVLHLSVPVLFRGRDEDQQKRDAS